MYKLAQFRNLSICKTIVEILHPYKKRDADIKADQFYKRRQNCKPQKELNAKEKRRYIPGFSINMENLKECNMYVITQGYGKLHGCKSQSCIQDMIYFDTKNLIFNIKRSVCEQAYGYTLLQQIMQ